MTHEAKLMCGITLITIPSIQYGGYFLLRLLSGYHQELELNSFQKAMFRAGHAHAGVLVILSLVSQLLADEAALSIELIWFIRAGVVAAAILIGGGFFFSGMGKGVTSPNKLISLLYLGIFILAVSLVTLGIGLLR